MAMMLASWLQYMYVLVDKCRVYSRYKVYVITDLTAKQACNAAAIHSSLL